MLLQILQGGRCLLGLAALALLSLPASAQVSASPTADEVALPSGADAATSSSTDQVIMRINGEDVTRGQFDNMLGDMLRKQMMGMAQQNQEPKAGDFSRMRSELAGEAHSNLIKSCVLKQAIEGAKAKVTDKQIDGELDKLKTNLKANGLSYEEFLKERKRTDAEVRDAVREQLTVTSLISESEGSVEPTEKEITDLFEQNKEHLNQQEKVRASHILIGFPGDPRDPKKAAPTDEEKAALKKKAEDVLAKVKAGGDFAQLAKENSTCPSKEKGGDLGMFDQSQMVPAFSKAAFALKPGEVSDVVETEFGYHIIKVTERQEGKAATLEGEHDKIREYLVSQNTMKKIEPFVEKLVSKAKVEELVPAKDLTPPAPAADPSAALGAPGALPGAAPAPEAK